MMTPFMVGELSDIVVAASCAAILSRGAGVESVAVGSVWLSVVVSVGV